MKVIGIGEKKTLTPFITACDKFIYLEILNPENDETTETTSKEQNEKISRLEKTIEQNKS
jgi:hypothetical protein